MDNFGEEFKWMSGPIDENTISPEDAFLEIIGLQKEDLSNKTIMMKLMKICQSIAKKGDKEKKIKIIRRREGFFVKYTSFGEFSYIIQWVGNLEAALDEVTRYERIS